MSRSAFALYCDDIREEINGKSSLMGVYEGNLVVESLPVRLPKLCVVIFSRFSPDNPVKTFKVTVELNGEVIASIPVTETEYKSHFNEDDFADNHSLINIKTNVIFSPFVINEDGTLQAKIFLDDELIDCEPLHIRAKNKNK